MKYSIKYFLSLFFRPGVLPIKRRLKFALWGSILILPNITFSLSVTNTSPASFSLSVSSDALVQIEFDSSISNESVNASTFKVWGKQTGFYAGGYSYGSSTFDNSLNFKPGEEVIVMLNTGILSSSGEPLAPYQFQFRVASEVSTNFGFYVTGQENGGNRVFTVDLGDLDNDGDLDLFTSAIDSCKVWLNDGSGTNFTGTGQELAVFANDVVLGDLNSDGKLDAISVQDTGAIVWLNDGSGTNFSGHNINGSENGGISVDLADLNGDGSLDIFAVYSYYGVSGIRVWINDGSGTNFIKTQQSAFLGSLPRGIALGNLDGDGDIDAVANQRSVNSSHVWLNDGTGTNFTNIANTSLGFGPTSFSLADVDGDHDLDIAAGGEIYLNDGTGTNLTHSVSVWPGFKFIFGDVDGDGDSDVIKCGLTLSIPSHQNAVLLNDGTGTNFTNSIFQFNDTNNTYDIALGDLDGDNDLDIVFGNQTNYSVWLNVSCHETNDLDNDGIPTKYEIQYGLNPVVNDAMGDNDSDHQNNIDEFIAGKLPVDSNSFFFVAAIVVMSPTQIHFDSVTGRIYSAEYSEALSSIPQAWVEFTNNIPGTGETIVINDSGVSTNRIFRVKVRLNP